MMPRTHLLSIVPIIILLSVFYNLEIQSLLLWLFVAAIVTLAVDVDHLFYPLLKREQWHIMKKIIKDPLYILKNPSKFAEEIHFRGLGIIRLGIHTVWGFAIYLFTLKLFPLLAIPVVASIAIHILLDLFQAVTCPETR